MAANKQLAAAVMATFRPVDAAQHAPLLQTFSVGAWDSTLHWLDASGLALYFRKRLKQLRIESCMPGCAWSQLEHRHRDNQSRTKSVLEELDRFNREFQRAGIQYVNLKGFTLVPGYCPDLSLRYQLDCDFLVPADDARRCSEILKRLGYEQIAASRHVMEFKADGARVPRIAQLYKPSRRPSVELHICDQEFPHLHPSLLHRARKLMLDGAVCPALSVEDMFVCQVQHVFRHLCSEWTRISWLLELGYFSDNYHDGRFWQEMSAKSSEDRELEISLGVVAKLAEAAFGSCSENALMRESIERLPPAVSLWAEHYGGEMLLSDFPGTKLYLLLEQALGNKKTSIRTRRLFPVRLPGRVIAKSRRGLRETAAALLTQSRYVFFRLRFHVRADLQYVVASWRWTRLCKRVKPRNSSSTQSTCAAGAAD